MGPGQEKHLPHEAWHVVQQMQGRVQPTVQTMDRVPVNDDEKLEHEADVMGLKALAYEGWRHELGPDGVSAAQSKFDFGQPTTEKNAARTGARAGGGQWSGESQKGYATNPPDPATASYYPLHPPSPAPIQYILVKKQKRQYIGQDVYIPAQQGDKEAVDTKTMKFSVFKQVQSDLTGKKDRKSQQALQDLAKEMAIISKKVDEKEILELGTQLDKLTAEKKEGLLNSASTLQLGEISFRVLHALEFLGEFDEADSDAIRFRMLLQKYLDQITQLDEKALSTAVERAEPGIDLNVTTEDVTAYREDIADHYIRGGAAEAIVIANAFNFQCRLLILDRQHRYVLVDTIGPANPRQRSLLNIGNHYVVVSDPAVAGHPYNKAHVLYPAPPDGDCLFWALFDVAANGALTVQVVQVVHPQPLDAKAFVTRARAIAATHLSDDQIKQTIIESRFSGGRGSAARPAPESTQV